VVDGSGLENRYSKKKLSRVRIPLSPVVFQQSHLLVRSNKKKKRIARLYIAELQGSSWKESILKYSYPADMGDRCNEIESISLPSGSIYFFS
jgi:hypothetical protein